MVRLSGTCSQPAAQFVKQGERGGSESHHGLLPRFVTRHGEPRAAAVALNVLRGQVFQVDIGQPRVRRKYKQVARKCPCAMHIERRQLVKLIAG